MAHFLADREKLHSNLLGLHVTRGSWITDGNLHALAAGVYAKSSGAAAAGARAADLIGARLRLQAYALSLNDGFLLVAWACVVGLLLTALLRKSPLNYGDLSTLQPVKETKSMKLKLPLLLIILVLSGALAFAGQAGDTRPSRHITLHEAVQLALQHNHAIHIAEYKVEEKQHAKEVAKSAYFPAIRNESNFIRLTDTQLIQINPGSLGTVAGSPVPAANSIINQGGRDLIDQRHPADTAPDHAAENPAR